MIQVVVELNLWPLVTIFSFVVKKDSCSALISYLMLIAAVFLFISFTVLCSNSRQVVLSA